MENVSHEENGSEHLENHDGGDNGSNEEFEIADSQDSFNYHMFQDYVYDENNESDTVIANNISLIPQCLCHTLYHVDWLKDPEQHSSKLCLICLCCKEITRDANFLRRVCAYLPINQFDLLMEVAICKDFHDSAVVLMSCWPSKSISISVIDAEELLRQVFYNACSNFLLSKRLLILWELFYDAVKNDTLQNVRVLDLRGVPLGDAMVYFLLRQINNLPADEHSNYYQVIVDCVVYSPWTFKKLTSFLTTANRCKMYKIQLRINTIDVTDLRETHCSTLLQAINPSDLVGLRLNSLHSYDFYVGVFTKFSSLKNLDVPILSMTKPQKLLPFQLLTNLRRLGFAVGSDNFSTTVPGSVLSKLEYFKNCNQSSMVVVMERAVELKLQHLISTPLILRELNLNGNIMFESHLNLWRDLLRSLVSTLTILELDGCVKSEILFPSLVTFILPLIKLRYLSLLENQLSLRTLGEYVPKLSSMPAIKTLRMTAVDVNGNNEPKENFVKRFNEMTALKLTDSKVFVVKPACVKNILL